MLTFVTVSIQALQGGDCIVENSIGRRVRPTYSCSVCEASWTSKKKSGLPQRCPRCKSKLWNKSYKHTCSKCGYGWVSASPSPERCPGCQTKKWRKADTEVIQAPHSALPKEVKIPILLRYDAGNGCVKIARDLNVTFSEVYDVIVDTYPEKNPRL